VKYDGSLVGIKVGNIVVINDGSDDGFIVGSIEGFMDGLEVVGCLVGFKIDRKDGLRVKLGFIVS